MSNQFVAEFNKSLVGIAKLGIKTFFATSAIIGLGGSYFLPSMAQHDKDVLTFNKPAGIF